MENPRRRTTVARAAGGDGLRVFDHQQQEYALNATSALVWQHCDGYTTPEQLMELLRRNFDVSRAQAEQLTWLALDELGKANLLETEVMRPRPLSSKLTRRQMLTGFATAGVALGLAPMVAPVTAQASADSGLGPSSTANNDAQLDTLAYYLNVKDFVKSLVDIPATPLKHGSTTAAQYLAGIANIYIPGHDRNSVGRCSASFLCFKNDQRIYTDISNYLSVDNGLIVSWFTPTTLINLALDGIINSMVTECIVVASTKIGVNPFYGQTFNLVVSSETSAEGMHQILFTFASV